MRRALPIRVFVVGVLASWAMPVAAAPASAEMIVLQQEMSTLLSSRPGEYGIAAIDLRDGHSAAINGSVAFPMASTVKLAIAAAYLTEVDQGRRSLNDLVNGRPARQVMEAMIVRSDNLAADQMFAALGGPARVQQWLSFHGIGGIRVDRTIAQLLRERGHLADQKDVATPVAMVRLLQLIDGDAVLLPESRGFLLDLMRRCRTGTRRIRALLPAGTLVEDKTGTLDGISNDVGFVTMPDGRRLAIAVFARGGRDRQPVIAQVARMIYDNFANRVRNAVAEFMRLQ